MEAKDASDDEKNSVGGKSPKLEIVDAVENDGHSSPEEKEITESVKPNVKKSRKKKTISTKRKTVRPKTTNTSSRMRKRPSQTGLNGNYWNVVQIDRHANTTPLSRSQLGDDDDDDEDDTTSSSEGETHEKTSEIINFYFIIVFN